MTNFVHTKKNPYKIYASLDERLRDELSGKAIEELVALYVRRSAANRVDFKRPDTKLALAAMLAIVNDEKRYALHFAEDIVLDYLSVNAVDTTFVKNKQELCDFVFRKSGLYTPEALRAVDDLFGDVPAYSCIVPQAKQISDAVAAFRKGNSTLSYLQDSLLDLRCSVLAVPGISVPVGCLIEKEKTVSSLVKKIMPYLLRGLAKDDFSNKHFFLNDSFGFALVMNELIDYTPDGFAASGLAVLLDNLKSDAYLDMLYDAHRDNFYLSGSDVMKKPVAGVQAYVRPAEVVKLDEHMLSGNSALLVSFHGFCLAAYSAGMFGLFHRAHDHYKMRGRVELERMRAAFSADYARVEESALDILSYSKSAFE